MGFLEGFADGLKDGTEIGDIWSRQKLARDKFESGNQRATSAEQRATEQQDWMRDDRDDAQKKAEEAKQKAENVAEGARIFGMRDSKRMTLWAYGNRLIDRDMKLQFNQDNGLDVLGADGKTLRTLTPQNMLMAMNSFAGPEAVNTGLKAVMEHNQRLGQIQASGDQQRATSRQNAEWDLEKDARRRYATSQDPKWVTQMGDRTVGVSPTGNVRDLGPAPTRTTSAQDPLNAAKARVELYGNSLPKEKETTITASGVTDRDLSRSQIARNILQNPNSGKEERSIAQAYLDANQYYARMLDAVRQRAGGGAPSPSATGAAPAPGVGQAQNAGQMGNPSTARVMQILQGAKVGEVRVIPETGQKVRLNSNGKAEFYGVRLKK
ncbi:MAG: hypothetical protein PWQ57_3287 [Desulfovibrionales bacterium]|nr:hypothetical protein [Desulfovibrionales bacterium]